MTAMKKKITFADILGNLPPKSEKQNLLEVMGPNVRRIPFALWEDRFFFRGALNTVLREKTGSFPCKLGKKGETHPVFLLQKVGNYAFRTCPCTSKRKPGVRYVRMGCILEYTKREMDKDSYILEQYSFNLSADEAFHRDLFFEGRVPETCLKKT